MIILSRALSALATVDHSAQWLRASYINGEARLHLDGQRWRHSEVVAALVDEFGPDSEVRAWYTTSGDTQTLVASVKVERPFREEARNE